MARGVRGSKDGNSRFGERGGQVEGAAIDTDHGVGTAGGVDKALKSGEMHVTAANFFESARGVGRSVDYQRQIEQGCKLRPMFWGPLLRAPSREGTGEHKLARGERAFGLTCREWEGAQEFRGTGAGGEFEVAFDGVLGEGLDLLGIEQGGGAFADAFTVEADEML